jgi:protein-tyrosine phosphatase
MNSMDEIEPGLYMGGEITRKPPGIQAIVDLQSEQDQVLSPEGLNALLWLPLYDHCDDAPDPIWLDSVVNTIKSWRSMNWRVLIHCRAGISRSGMVTIAYIMNTRNLGWYDALAIVRAGRPCCDPNPGFMHSLSRYATYLQQGDEDA